MPDELTSGALKAADAMAAAGAQCPPGDVEKVRRCVRTRVGGWCTRRCSCHADWRVSLTQRARPRCCPTPAATTHTHTGALRAEEPGA
jgi:hypothetical protein